MSDVHGVEVDFGHGTEHIKELLRKMDKHDAMKFFDHARDNHGKSGIMNSRIEHTKEGDEDHFSVHLHN